MKFSLRSKENKIISIYLVIFMFLLSSYIIYISINNTMYVGYIILIYGIISVVLFGLILNCLDCFRACIYIDIEQKQITFVGIIKHTFLVEEIIKMEAKEYWTVSIELKLKNKQVKRFEGYKSFILKRNDIYKTKEILKNIETAFKH